MMNGTIGDGIEHWLVGHAAESAAVISAWLDGLGIGQAG
jgi:hypothetical protein